MKKFRTHLIVFDNSLDNRTRIGDLLLNSSLLVYDSSYYTVLPEHIRMTEPSPPPKAKILIVEDEVLIGQALQARLSHWGYTVLDPVFSAEKALEFIEGTPPDLILMDIVLQGKMDGIEAAEIIRSRWRIPIIFTSAHADLIKLERAKLTSPFGYLLKPYQDHETRVTVEMALYVSKVDEERRKTEEALKKSEERLRHLIESTNDWIWEVDRNGVYTYVSSHSRQLLGYAPEEITGKTPFDLMPPEEADRLLTIFNSHMTERKPFYRLENLNRHKDGHLVILETNGVPIIAEDGQFQGYRGMDRDITERKKAEKVIRDSEARFKAQYQGNPTPVFTWQRKEGDFELIDFNQATRTITQGRVAEFLGEKASTLYAHRPDILGDLLRCFEEKEIIKRVTTSSEYFIPGRLIVITDVFVPPDLVMLHLEDITERKQAEETLQQSEEKYRALIETTNTGYLIVDAQGRVLDANQEYLRLTGHSSLEEILGRSVLEWTAPHDLERNASEVKKCLDLGGVRNLEIDYINQSGQITPIEINATILDSGESVRIMALCRDITERKQIEKQVRSLGHQLLKIQEDEKRNISRELHDVIGQNLLTLKIGLDSLFKPLAETFPEFKPKALELTGLMQQTVENVRDMAHHLRPSSLEQLGLVKAGLQYCEEFTAASNIEVDYSAVGIHESQLDYNTKITLYRLIQEGLNNIKKHSGADRVTIRLVSSFPNILLRIEDNGRGFNVKNSLDLAVKEKHLGLISMSERVSILQGQIKIQSEPGKGTKILIEVPSKAEKL
ncbi:MAG: hypothetical protein C0407_04540 [Desulfobacca sp.]|nr:hypothetical protein [Desulfobacca sp.]